MTPFLSLTPEQIGKLRAAAASMAAELPYRPLLLEMALVGLSRRSISSLLVSSFKEGVEGVYDGKPVAFPYAVVWYPKNNVRRVTRLTDGQWAIMQRYMDWRMTRVDVRKTPESQRQNLFFAKNRRGILVPMADERVRSEIRSVGRDALPHLDVPLEIPQLHRSMANLLRLAGVSETIIFELYGDDRRFGEKDD